MASSSRIFSQTFRFARNLKNASSKVQKISGSFHVTSLTTKSKKLCHLSRPAAAVCGLLNGQPNFNFKNKIQFASKPEHCTILARSAACFSPSAQASEDCGVSTSDGSDSSCEAMEGPHGDDDGLVIHGSYPPEDL